MDLTANEVNCEVKAGVKIKPISIGLISDPPTLVLIYEVPTGTDINFSSKARRRKRKMPLRNFTDRSKVQEYTFGLIQRHVSYLADVLPITVQKMLRVIQEVMKGLAIVDAVVKVNKEYEINGEEDLNKLTTDELDHKKAIMDEDFRKHLIQPGDPDYLYDKVVQFDTEKREPSTWDEDSDNDDLEVPQNTKSELGTSSKLLDANIKPIAGILNTSNKEIVELLDSPSVGIQEVILPEPESDMTTSILLEVVQEAEVPLNINVENESINSLHTKIEMNPLIKNEDEMKRSLSDSEGLDQVLEIETGFVESEDDDFWT